ncbi:MAG TPA: RtcB family protein [Phycisphaerae bacterium]|nr:RtcB family protein [Phycisphaerae bacterium]
MIRLGYPEGPVMGTARAAAGEARLAGQTRQQVKSKLAHVLREPEQFKDDPIFGRLAAAVAEAKPPEPPMETVHYDRPAELQYAVWGEDIDADAHRQMRNACSLPISVAGALMPDAHVGYGLPIGGVLATENAVIPYAVGVDIACRMMMTVFDLPPDKLKQDDYRYKIILEEQTRFGVGAEWKPKRQHPVMDEDWRVSRITLQVKDKAYRQLGTSGSGNHFVEFGELELLEEVRGVPAGRYLAVLSHSGSRGPGNQIATHYSRWAMSRHKSMPKELRHLAWLDMTGDGQEYWAAMELMGKFASANHHVIHRQIVAAVREPPLMQVENHHNFAWRERHGGRDVIVHRKGATPADKGVLGIIPGSMAAPAYLVEGLGDERSLHSASHGAGRRLSRSAAFKQFKWPEVKRLLAERGVALLSAGLDEAPWVYKNIDEVMAAQKDLVRPLARFMPRIVKMAPAGERPED